MNKHNVSPRELSQNDIKYFTQFECRLNINNSQGYVEFVKRITTNKLYDSSLYNFTKVMFHRYYYHR